MRCVEGRLTFKGSWFINRLQKEMSVQCLGLLPLYNTGSHLHPFTINVVKDDLGGDEGDNEGDDEGDDDGGANDDICANDVCLGHYAYHHSDNFHHNAYIWYTH